MIERPLKKRLIEPFFIFRVVVESYAPLHGGPFLLRLQVSRDWALLDLIPRSR